MGDVMPRGTCVVCGASRCLRSDGTVRAHGYGLHAERCSGSGLLPKGETLRTYEVDVKLHVPATSAAAAWEYVDRTLDREAKHNSALKVTSIETVGVVV